MLKPVVELLNKNNFYINNLDINLICEQPKVSKYRNKIIKSGGNIMTYSDMIKKFPTGKGVIIFG